MPRPTRIDKMIKISKAQYKILSDIDRWILWRISQLENMHNRLLNQYDLRSEDLQGQLDYIESEIEDLYSELI